MNFLKSLFVSVYMTAAMVSAVYAGWKLWLGESLLTWGGVLLVTAPFVVVIGVLMIFRRIARTSANFVSLIILGVVGVVLSHTGYAQGGSIAGPIFAVTGFVSFLAYVYWYSVFGRGESAKLFVGNMLPEFELRNVAGETVLSASLTDKAAIWLFYRGNWCPLCMAQIKELAAQYKALQEQGVRVVLISPQSHKKTAALAKKFDVGFDFLTDEGNLVARELDIANDFGTPMGMQMLGYTSETVMPTVVITDIGGRILWTHETDNYRVRPEPEQFMAVLREHQVIH
jgi:peroxiredoxin